MFSLTPLQAFYQRWQASGAQSIAQSHPQPFTVSELEALIGPLWQWQPDDLLDYARDAGGDALVQAIAGLYQQTGPAQVVSFAGAQEAIFALSHALLQTGDRLAVLTPCFQPLVHSFAERGIEVLKVPLDASRAWALDFNRLEAVLKQGCKLLVINYPHNPTGALITQEELQQLLALCAQHGCRVLSDEVFRGLEHSEEARLPACCDLDEHAVSIGVLSKGFALPAMRIGWVASHDAGLIRRLQAIRGHLSICNSLLDERLAVRVLQNAETILAHNRHRILQNKRTLQNFAQQNASWMDLTVPNAGCCAFFLFKDRRQAADQAVQWIEQQGLLVLPGKLFMGPDHGFRLGFGMQAQVDQYHRLHG